MGYHIWHMRSGIYCRCALKDTKAAKGVMINTNVDGNKSTEYDMIGYTNYLPDP